MLPVTPMASVTTPATTDRDSKVGKSTDPIISIEALQPTVSGPSVPSTPRCSTRSTKGVPPDRYTHPRSSCHGIQWMFHLCRTCSESVGLLVSSVSHVQTCETWNYVEYSSPLVHSKFYSSVT